MARFDETDSVPTKLTPSQIAAQVALATAKSKLNANPQSVSALKAVQKALTAQDKVLGETGTSLAANDTAIKAAQKAAEDAAIQAKIDAALAKSTAEATFDTIKNTPVGDPNANKPGHYFNKKSGKWVPVPERPTGTSSKYIFNPETGEYEQPPRPGGSTPYVWDNLNGWVESTVILGPTGLNTVQGVNGASPTVSTKTLAINTFKNTLALFFGAKEISKPWVDGVYKAMNAYYETGSTFEEALNLTVQEARNNPAMAEFTKRFAGLYALTDRLAGNEALVVPTVAEWVKSEAAVGEVLTRAGMGELATQEFAGKVLGLNKSVSEIATLINDTFYRIDNAPKDLKDTLDIHFGQLSRVDLAKALLMGKEGAVELDNKIKGLSVLSAAGTQGSVIDYATASDIAKQGYGYKEALAGFGKVKDLGRGKDLGNIYGEKVSDKETRDAVFGQNADALAKFDRLGRQEDASFSAKSGMTASSLRASRTI